MFHKGTVSDASRRRGLQARSGMVAASFWRTGAICAHVPGSGLHHTTGIHPHLHPCFSGVPTLDTFDLAKWNTNPNPRQTYGRFASPLFLPSSGFQLPHTDLAIVSTRRVHPPPRRSFSITSASLLPFACIRVARYCYTWLACPLRTFLSFSATASSRRDSFAHAILGEEATTVRITASPHSTHYDR